MNAMDAKKNAKNAIDAKKKRMNAIDAPRARGARCDGVHSRTCAFMRVHFNPQLNVTIIFQLTVMGVHAHWDALDRPALCR